MSGANEDERGKQPFVTRGEWPLAFGLLLAAIAGFLEAYCQAKVLGLIP